MSNKVISICISILIITLSVCFLIFPKVKFSENENRFLEDMPKFNFEQIKKGNYTKGINNYVTDHFPFRNMFMNIRTSSEKLLNKTEINNVYMGREGYLIEKYNKPVNTDKIIKKFNRFNDNLKDSNLKLLLVPTSISVNKDKVKDNIVLYNQMDTINKLYNEINFDSVNIYDKLNESKEQVFYKLDHHWTTYGAFIGYSEYMKNLGIKPYSVDQFKIKKVTDEFKGTLYSKVIDDTLKPDSIYIYETDNKYTVEYKDDKKITNSMYEYSYLDKKDKYSLFLNNNHSLIEITNESIDSNNEMVIIKDSYANCFIPFVANHFKKVYVIDLRFYNETVSEFINDKNIKNVLILYNINSLDSNVNILSIK